MTHNDPVSRQKVRRQAWWTWGLLLLLCVAATLVLLPQAERLALAGPGDGGAWLMVPILWLILAVPATLGVYGACFRGGWGPSLALSTGDETLPDDPATAAKSSAGSEVSDGGGIRIESALRGMTSVWAVLTAGVLLSLGACVVAGTATPGIWPGVFMLMLLVLARPSISPAFAD